MISIITPTGDRPIQLGLLAMWMRFQDYGGEWEWIIIDDSKKDYPSWVLNSIHEEGHTAHVRHIPREGNEPPGPLSFIQNMYRGIEEAKGDSILMAEDDDWYDSSYIRIFEKALSAFPAVGTKRTLYYHLPNQVYRIMRGFTWHSTGFHRDLIPLVRDALHRCDMRKRGGLDVEFWKAIQAQGIHRHLESNNPFLMVGIKGLPGRQGLGGGHRLKEGRGAVKDPDYFYLRRVIGKPSLKAYFERLEIPCQDFISME